MFTQPSISRFPLPLWQSRVLHILICKWKWAKKIPKNIFCTSFERMWTARMVTKEILWLFWCKSRGITWHQKVSGYFSDSLSTFSRCHCLHLLIPIFLLMSKSHTSNRVWISFSAFVEGRNFAFFFLQLRKVNQLAINKFSLKLIIFTFSFDPLICIGYIPLNSLLIDTIFHFLQQIYFFSLPTWAQLSAQTELKQLILLLFKSNNVQPREHKRLREKKKKISSNTFLKI